MFVLLHAGNLGFYGAWETLLAGARDLASEGVGLVFVGDGAQRARLEAAGAGAANIRFLPFFSAEKIPSVLAAADLHIVTVKRGLEGVVVPSKLFGILCIGRRGAGGCAEKETDAATLGERQGFAVCSDPDQPGGMVDAVRSLLRAPERLAAMRLAARAAAPEYERAGEQEKFVRAVESAVAGDGKNRARE